MCVCAIRAPLLLDVIDFLLRLGARESVGVKSHELALIKSDRNSL